MKSIFLTAASALSLLAAGPLSAQTRLEAIVVPKEGNPLRVWISEVGNTGFRYFPTPQTTVLSNYALRDARSIFFPEPQALRAGMQLFRGRDYQAALPQFAKVAEAYQLVQTIPNNPASRALFFEIECLRLLGDYTKMSEKLGAFNKSGITRENELRQLELNLMWEAVGSESWDRLESLVKEQSNNRIPSDQRAQVAYCKGLIHEKKGETKEAISAYNEAMIVDAAASEVVARMAALAVLRIYDADPDVKAAREAWDTDQQKPNSPGYTKLLEAGAVARMVNAFMGAGKPLPDDFKPYLDYQAPEQES